MTAALWVGVWKRLHASRTGKKCRKIKGSDTLLGSYGAADLTLFHDHSRIL